MGGSIGMFICRKIPISSDAEKGQKSDFELKYVVGDQVLASGLSPPGATGAGGLNPTIFPPTLRLSGSSVMTGWPKKRLPPTVRLSGNLVDVGAEQIEVAADGEIGRQLGDAHF